MAKTSSRCDRILALIDACLADIDNPERVCGAAGSPASSSPRIISASRA